MPSSKPNNAELKRLFLLGVTKPILCTHFKLPMAKVIKATRGVRRNMAVNRTHSMTVLRQAGYLALQPLGRPGTSDAIKEKVIALWKRGVKYGKIGAEFNMSGAWAGFIIRAHPDYVAPLRPEGRPPAIPKEAGPTPPVSKAKALDALAELVKASTEPKSRKHQLAPELPPRPADFDLRTWPVLGPGDRPDRFDEKTTGYFDADVFGEKKQYSTCLI
jgi:hypothetical protein